MNSKNNKAVKRILDVNINRAREGLRIMEDYARFALNDKKLTGNIKTVRHLISKAIDRFDLVSSRASEKDLGRPASFDKKAKTVSLENVIIANIIRVEESTRVLEEFSKIIYPESSAAFKKARFLIYDLEKKFILNDRADLAVLAGADGLHLGQKDLPVREARKIFKGFIGISTHNNKEIMKALKGNVDYIGFGPVFRTNTKKGLPPVAGLRRLENVVSKVSIPVVAIGGINSTNIKEVYKSGVSCAAVISAICVARKPITKIKALITKKEAY